MPLDAIQVAVTYRVEPFTGLREEGAPLFLEHWAESSADQSVPLNMNWSLYDAMERAGLLVCITARRDGRLIGYALYIVHTHLHYRDRVIADSDAFFLNAADRHGWVGINLFRRAEAEMRHRGVDEVWARVKLHVKGGRRRRFDLRRVFEWLGYRPVEIVLRKRIG